MSRREPSYYEIALTQRQVVVAFVIVLVCLLSSFFLGVWVGQGGSLPEPSVRQADAAQDAGEETAMDETETDDGKLRFFSEDGSAGTAPPPDEEPAEPDRPTSLREDLDRGTPPAETSPPAQADPEPETQAPPRQPPAQPPQQARPSEPLQPAPTRTNLPPGGSGFVVQVFSSDDQAQAQRVLDRLLSADQDAFLHPQEIEGRVMYRVRVGPFETRERAEVIAGRVEREMQLDTWVTQQ